MSETEGESEVSRKSGWDEVSALDIKPREAPAPAKFRAGLWVSLWVLLCALLSSWFVSRSMLVGSDPGAQGYLLGSFLGVWLLAFGLGWVAFRISGRSLLAGRLVICLLAFLSMVSNLRHVVDASSERQQQESLAKELQADWSKFAQADSEAGPMAALDSGTTIGGESGEIQVFVRAYMNKVIAQNNDYMAELDALGWSDVLDPTRLRDDVDLVDTRATVTGAKASVAKYRQLWAETFRQTQAELQAMDTGTPMKRGFIAGFNRSSAKATTQAMLVWDLEAQIVATTGELAEMLGSRRDTWTAQDGQFEFSDDQALSYFNAYLEKISELGKREEEIRNAGRARTQRGLEQLEQP